MLDEQGACSAVGSPATVLQQMERFVERTGVDELIIASQIFDHEARVRSFEIAMNVWSSRPGRRTPEHGGESEGQGGRPAGGEGQAPWSGAGRYTFHE